MMMNFVHHIDGCFQPFMQPMGRLRTEAMNIATVADESEIALGRPISPSFDRLANRLIVGYVQQTLPTSNKQGGVR